MMQTKTEIIKSSDYLNKLLKICSVCKKISATDQDHIDCLEKRRVELEEADRKEKLPEKLDLAKNPEDLGVEVRAILDHLNREKVRSEKS